VSLSRADETIDNSRDKASRSTVLLVEDDAMLLGIVRTRLHLKGYRVLTAQDVSEAEEHWAMANQIIDVVISDNKLGEDRGAELVQRFQKQQPDVQYVLCSGAPLEQEIPGVSFLMKPFNVDVILKDDECPRTERRSGPPS
jgi:DNA-binding NtrC family response regulator